MRTELMDIPFATEVLTNSYVKDKDVDRLELEAARRALSLIKGRLGPKRMLELIREDVEESDRQWEAWAAESNGEWRVNKTDVAVSGLDVDFWLNWLRTNLGNESALFAAHPEHYVWTTAFKLDDDAAANDYVLVEPMGTHMWRTYVFEEEWDGHEAYIDPDATRRMCLAFYTRNGVMVGRSIAQYTETDDGFTFQLTAMKPTAVPPDMLPGNAEHGRLEYHRCMEMARAEWSANVGGGSSHSLPKP